jgi:hypothetical protein
MSAGLLGLPLLLLLLAATAVAAAAVWSVMLRSSRCCLQKRAIRFDSSKDRGVFEN